MSYIHIFFSINHTQIAKLQCFSLNVLQILTCTNLNKSDNMLAFFFYILMINNLLHRSPQFLKICWWAFILLKVLLWLLLRWFKSSCSDHQSLTHSDMNNAYVPRSGLAFFHLEFDHVFVYELCIGPTTKLVVVPLIPLAPNFSCKWWK